MKAVAPRIDRLFESEVQRWRAAWQRHIDDALSVMTCDELSVFVNITEEDGAALDALDGALLASMFPAESLPAWKAWLDGYWNIDFEAPDLSRWPDGIPRPPDEPAGVWDALREIVTTYAARQDDGMHARAQGATCLLLRLSGARQVRTSR